MLPRALSSVAPLLTFYSQGLINQRDNEFWGAFYKHGLTLIPTWISNHMPSNVWYEITYPFLSFNGATVEV